MSDIDINKIRRLDGGLLLVFRELLRTGKASEVAARLGLSQPAISHALGRLRDLFEDPLFVRRPHGLEPTRRALELGPMIEGLLELADETLNGRPDFDPAQSRRQFRMSAPEFVAALIGAPLIERFGVQAPHATFAIGHLAADAAFEGLRRGDMDLALGRFTTVPAGFVVEPLFDDAYCCVARRGHPRAPGRITEQDWRDIGHIFAWSPSETGPELDGPFPEVIRMRAAVPHWLTVLLLVASTDAIATVPRRLAERHAERLGLQVLDLPFPPNPIFVAAARRAGQRDPGLDWFLGEVRTAALA
jgi:DNA-binding transcriptional LysR family regulator